LQKRSKKRLIPALRDKKVCAAFQSGCFCFNFLASGHAP